MKVQLDKTELMCKELVFLGHGVAQQGINPNPQKIEAIKEFLEIVELYKNILANEQIFQYPDFVKSFIFTTDASNEAISTKLSQEIIGQNLPIAYASRNINNTEGFYSTIVRKFLASVWEVKHSNIHLYGSKFEICYDHKPL